MRGFIPALMATAALTAVATTAKAQDQFSVTLIPGLTTDAFYITMRKGAEEAAKALGVEFSFQGAPNFNPTEQIPVLRSRHRARSGCHPNCTHRQDPTHRAAATGK